MPGIIADAPSISVDDDGSLLAAGFNYINGYPMQPAARYANGTWRQLGTPAANYYLAKVFTWRDELYATGWIRDSSGVRTYGLAKFESDDWKFIVSANDACEAFTHPSGLYLYGRFDTINKLVASHLARWTGDKLEPLDHGLTWTQGAYYQDRGVRRLCAEGNWIYVLGYFSFTDSITSRNIYRFNVSTHEVTSLGTGANAQIWDLEWWRGQMYALGGFDEAGGTPAFRLASWNGSKWSAVGSARDLLALHSGELMEYNDELLVHGQLTAAGKLRPKNVVNWNGREWSARYEQEDRTVRLIVTRNNELIGFTDSAGRYLEISRLSDTLWKTMTFPMHEGMLGLTGISRVEPSVTSVAATDSFLYVSGDVQHITPDGTVLQNFLRFDGHEWSQMRDSLGYEAKLYAHGSRLFISTGATLHELINDTLQRIRTFNSWITDIDLNGLRICVGLMYDVEPSIYVAPMSTLNFEALPAARGVKQIKMHGADVYFISDNVLYQLQDGRLRSILRPTRDDESFADLAFVGNTLYLIGRLYGPSGYCFLVRYVIDSKLTTQDAPDSNYVEWANNILTIGDRTFITGGLGRTNGRTHSIGYERGGEFTFLSDAVDGPVTMLCQFKGDLYLAGVERIGSAQSSGIARAILGPSSVRNRVYAEEAAKGLLVRGALHLTKPAFTITDLLGRNVRVIGAQEIQVDLSDLPPALYLLRYRDGSVCKLQILR